MRKELGQVRQKKKKLLEKKALIDEQLELLSLRETSARRRNANECGGG